MTHRWDGNTVSLVNKEIHNFNNLYDYSEKWVWISNQCEKICVKTIFNSVRKRMFWSFQIWYLEIKKKKPKTRNSYLNWKLFFMYVLVSRGIKLIFYPKAAVFWV